ncbi:MAG: DUF1697 domain-containing protein [Thermomicrobiales bacterium]|nr:DUF1697 domain-containing protein [Thermomicrobiales bacterium]
MSTRLLFVRAVNVGGCKLPMQEFRELLNELGAGRVQTYIASGNAVVDIDGDADAFDRAVEREMEQRFGWFREVMSRTPDEVRQALDAYPFDVVEPKYSYVVFLAEAPAEENIRIAREIDTGDDQWSVLGREIHLQYAGGAGKANPGIDKSLRRLRVPGTARNLNTVRKMLEMAGE